jgi:large subunit ribosomal protein L20
MPRTKSSVASRKRRRAVLKRVRGFRGSRGKLLRQAYVSLDRAMAMAYVGRKQKKRAYRRLWNVRINAACRAAGSNYSTFMHGLHLAGVDLNRKVLAEIAVSDPEAFTALLEKARAARETAKS